MTADVFIDSTILVYAHDADAGEKHQKAQALIRPFWNQRAQPFLSVQVFQEVHVNLVRLGVPVAQSVTTVSNYFAWRVIESTRQLLKKGFENQQRWQLSFWDSLIVAAAQQAGVNTLWSEDLNEGQCYEAVQVVNPLMSRVVG